MLRNLNEVCVKMPDWAWYTGGDNDGLSCRGHHKSPFTNPAEYLVGPGDGNSHRYVESGKSLEVHTMGRGYLGKDLNSQKGLNRWWSWAFKGRLDCDRMN